MKENIQYKQITFEKQIVILKVVIGISEIIGAFALEWEVLQPTNEAGKFISFDIRFLAAEELVHLAKELENMIKPQTNNPFGKLFVSSNPNAGPASPQGPTMYNANTFKLVKPEYNTRVISVDFKKKTVLSAMSTEA